jgi:hypothetical protein
MHSWRVLVLPFLDQGTLYDRYNFREPWNGPHNRELEKYRAPFDVCPADDSAKRPPAATSYLAVVGPGTVWEGQDNAAVLRPSGERRILLAEVAGSDVSWMEPKDLTVEEALRGINSPGGGGISSSHPGGANVILVDGRGEIRPEFLPSDTTGETLRALLVGKEGSRRAKE